jgi:hypothetical protein
MARAEISLMADSGFGNILEYPHYPCPSLDLLIKTLKSVCGPDPSAMRGLESEISKGSPQPH